MNHKESARKAMSSLKIEGFEFDQESRKMWNEIENGRLTTHDAKRLIFEELERLRIEQPEKFTTPNDHRTMVGIR